MVPPVPTSQKAAWQWAETTKPEEVTLNHVLTAYKMNLNFCNSCRRNVKGNPCCLSGLGEKPWLSDVPPVDASDLLREKDSYVGLKNLGATCYANAFLQVWFHMPEIRNAVFSWDTDSLDIKDDVYSPICEIISCLQEVFGLLYFSKRKYIDPTILLNCLLLDNTVQQDAQEFSKLFMSKLEELPSHGRSIFHDFVGRYDYVTSCTQCGNQTRSRSEFYELDLNIVNNKKLSSCLEEFLEQEMLDGDNQFFCSSCKMKQNATRCIELVELPSTLNLQLLRFVYDKEKHSKKKISSPLTFPDTLDMSPYVKRNSNNSSPVSEESYIYDLFAILIHSGQLANSGHYIAVIRDCKTAATFQFNDEKVIKLEGDLSGYDLDNAIEEDCLTSDNNSNSSLNNKTKKSKSSKEMSLVNAYMLVYRKRNATVNVCEDLEFEELPNNLKEKILIHNKELDKDLLRESHKREMLNQKVENIKLLYSTIMSYEGCSAEEKLEKFEFVPVQNLMKFFQDNEIEIADGDMLGAMKENVIDDVIETNIDDDDDPGPDVSTATHHSDDKEIGKLFFCKHKKLNPDKVVNLKLLPSNVVDIIANQLGLSVRLPCPEVLCRECVVERCTNINSKMALSEDIKKIASLTKSKNYQPTGFLVGKESWKNWRKLVEKDNKDGMEDHEQIGMKSELFNSDLLCIHDGLDPNQQNWKPVSSDVWKILKKYFPTCPEYPCGAPCCSTCEDKSQQEQIEQDESKQQALQLKQYLSDLFLNKRRPSLSTLRKHQAHLNKQKQQIQNEALISMECKSSFQTPSTMSREVVVVNIADEDSKPDSTHHAELEEVEDRIRVEEVDRPLNNQLRYFLVSSTFIERWKKCCKDSSKHEMPASVCNRLLVCRHGKLLFDPWDSEKSNEIGRQFVLLWPNEWQILKNYFHVDHEVFVEITGTKSSGSHFAISVPELCVDCLEERRKEEIQSRFHYVKAKIYVHRLDSFDSDSSAIQQCVLSVNNDDNYSNNTGVEEKSKKRKSDDDVPGEKYPRLECCAAVRRSGRRSKNRGEKEIVVSSDTTLKDLHIEIFRQFQVYKTNQVLHFDGRELVGDDCTLGELCVPPEALIKLEVLEDLEENFTPHTVGGGSVIEEGFKGTGLVG